MPGKEIVDVKLAAPNPNLSPATRFGNLVFVAGQTGLVAACATPFAAFAAVAALTLSRGDAFRITVALWLADQIVGYAIHGYPRTHESFAWGA